MNNGLLLLHPESPAFNFQFDWAPENITNTFFKCIRWQVEETTDPFHCPYHYYCDSTYPGNYPPFIDFSVLVLAAASYLVIIAFNVMEMKGMTPRIRFRRRYWLPSGPIALPFILLSLARGHRIDTFFPLSHLGPLLLQMLLISALSFENPPDKNVKYALFEVSTVSGILHASLYLDSVILPYYTGLEALVTSTLSGECASCICRREVLVAGGTLVSYRGWSMTSFSVVGALFSRMVCTWIGEDKGSVLMRLMLEGFGWILIAADAVYLMVNSPQGGLIERAAFGGVCALICLHFLKKLYAIWCHAK
ncbi:hypothetical protein CKAN_00952600 [Cinnamomum micranthum f. kanehirae]|uniref:Transmembrane protein n=1 Tax=Cinnamomum micranthum f. kanehirae TaxID=337451 RepID=A0A3S3N4Y5_9MAGN|nr:hypothetical protein CKAN_00952600 [Cinnamomum micranthum f. kanehirae]